MDRHIDLIARYFMHITFEGDESEKFCLERFKEENRQEVPEKTNCPHHPILKQMKD
jgi:hypothetical protein